MQILTTRAIIVSVLALGLLDGVARAQEHYSGAGPRYEACVAQHLQDFTISCAALRQAYKAEIFGLVGYVDEMIYDPGALCRRETAQLKAQFTEALGSGYPIEPSAFKQFYASCVAGAVKRNSNPEMLSLRKLNEDNAECQVLAVESSVVNRTRTMTPSYIGQFYTRCMETKGHPGQHLS
jgi:hypothetical protein